MLDLHPSLFTKLQALPADRLNRPAAWLVVLEALLQASGKIRVVQWGTGLGLDRLLGSDQVAQVVACESDAARCQQTQRTQATHLASGKLILNHCDTTALHTATAAGRYNPTHDFVLQPLRQLGEQKADLVILNPDLFAADCAEIARLLVKDGGLILWPGMTSWSGPKSDRPSGRDVQESAADFAEHYYLDQHQCLLLVNRPPGRDDARFRAWQARREFLTTMFRNLDQADIEYLLMSNPGNLPAIYGQKMPISQFLGQPARSAAINPESIPDIDVLVAKTQYAQAVRSLAASGLPLESGGGTQPALYSGGQQQFFFNHPHVIRVHLFDGLQYTSLDRVNRVGLHEGLQLAVLARRRLVSPFWRFAASVNDSLLHNLCRCLFDKRSVPDNYAVLIEDLYAAADLPALRQDLECVFFKFAGRLEELIQARQTPELCRAYLAFHNY